MTFYEVLILINCILAIMVIGTWAIYGVCCWFADRMVDLEYRLPKKHRKRRK